MERRERDEGRERGREGEREGGGVGAGSVSAAQGVAHRAWLTGRGSPKHSDEGGVD